MRRENTDVLKIRQKISGTLHEDEVRFVVAGDIMSPEKKRYLRLKWCQAVRNVGEV
jgi:hypothetical protein